jgi:transketolase
MVNLEQLKDIASVLRRDSLEMTTKAGSGHPSSCLSIAEIMSVLFFKEMQYDVKNSNNPDNDEFILSKGHAAPILYSCLKHAGCINDDLNSLRKFKSNLEGHPMPRSLDWIKIATGSLGQGLSVGLGMAIGAKLQKRKYNVYVLMGDSEVAEGSVYEAMELAAHYKINNLIGIVDVNRLGQRGETMQGHRLDDYRKRFSGFGWNVLEIDGHAIWQIHGAIKKAKNSKKPTMILAKTLKGKGVNFIENKEGWHGKSLNEEQLIKALAQIPKLELPKIKINKSRKLKGAVLKSRKPNSTKYNEKIDISTRESYGNALTNLVANDNKVMVLDSEVSNSTHADAIKVKKPKHFLEMYIAEQNMIGVSCGLAIKGFKVFASSFSAFLTRAYDQIRMGALSDVDLTICGSHGGASIGEDGASQMGLQDISMFRSLPGSIVMYPSDAVSTEKLTYLASKEMGLKYIRTTRDVTPILYNNKEKFRIGDFKVLRKSSKDKVVVVGCGITVSEILKAHRELQDKMNIAVVDLYCIKPFNGNKFIKFVKRHGEKVITVEDHYKEGGVGEMVNDVLINKNIKVRNLYVEGIPHSGTKLELLEKYNIDHQSIIKAVKDIK